MNRNKPIKKQGNRSICIANEPVSSAYTFDNFIAGNCNRVAWDVAMSIAENPVKAIHNPFVIYGNPGLGKSHLIAAIEHKTREDHPELNIVHLQAESFCSHLTEAIRNQNEWNFMRCFSKQDMLILEHMDHFAGKSAIQRYLVRVMDHLIDRGRQVILTSSVFPGELKEMDPKLISRITKGKVAEITNPDSETMFLILAQMVRQSEFEVPESLLKALASNPYKCVREAEGILIAAIAKARMQKVEISVELVDSILRKFGII